MEGYPLEFLEIPVKMAGIAKSQAIAFSEQIPPFEIEKVIGYSVCGYLAIFLLGILFVVFFNEKLIKNFFSSERGEYARPFVYYLMILWFIRIVNSETSTITLLVESFIILSLVKFIGHVNSKAGADILKILGGFILIEFTLRPVGNLEEIEFSLLISSIIVAFSILTIISIQRIRENVLPWFEKRTKWLIELLTKKEKQIV